MPYTVEERRKKGEGMEGKIGANLQFRTLCTNVPFNSRPSYQNSIQFRSRLQYKKFL